MDEAAFKLVQHDGDRVRMRCTRCSLVHTLPPVGDWPFTLRCACGNAARFVMGPWGCNAELLEGIKCLPDRSEQAHRRFPPTPN